MKKIKIRISGTTDTKLMYVKLIKEFAGLGLKEAKDLVDQSYAGKQSQLEIEVADFDIQRAIQSFKDIGLTVTNNSRELKLKRVLYKDQSILLKDMLKDISKWETLGLVSDEDKSKLTYNQCREKAIEAIYETYAEYVENDNFNVLYDEIQRINEMEIKPMDAKAMKFNEEFGEFNAEYLKFKGYTYKPYDREHLIEEMADALQCLLSIYAHVGKETGITISDVLREMFIKNKKWMDLISEYKINVK